MCRRKWPQPLQTITGEEESVQWRDMVNVGAELTNIKLQWKYTGYMVNDQGHGIGKVQFGGENNPGKSEKHWQLAHIKTET